MCKPENNIGIVVRVLFELSASAQSDGKAGSHFCARHLLVIDVGSGSDDDRRRDGGSSKESKDRKLHDVATLLDRLGPAWIGLAWLGVTGVAGCASSTLFVWLFVMAERSALIVRVCGCCAVLCCVPVSRWVGG